MAPRIEWSEELSTLQGTPPRECPICDAIIPRLSFWAPDYDAREWELTRWRCTCDGCGAILTIWND